MKKIALILFGILLVTNQIQAQFTLTDSLKAYYPFNNNANDESGNGNDGTPNGVTITNDRFGNANSAYHFDGVDDHIFLPESFLPVSNMPRSFLIWVDPIISLNEHIILQYGNNFTRGLVRILLETGKLSFRAYEDDYVTGTLLNETWSHICITYNGATEIRYYLNGNQVDLNNLGGNLNTNIGYYSETIGGGGTLGTDDPFSGKIDNVRIYNRVLSESEILRLYANYYPPDTLIAEPGNEQVTLSWDTTNWEYLDKVYIYRDLILHDSVNITSINDTSYTDLNLINYQKYSWFIQSKDDWGNMSISSDTITTFPCEIVTDWDGNRYKTTKIGDQIWMAENLSSTKYADGTPLVDGTGAGDIAGDYTTKYYFWYNDDSTIYADIYGALYTWVAVMNGATSSNNNPSGVQGVCPDGWHVPSDTAWKELELYLGMSQTEADKTNEWRGIDEGGRLKETDTIHWNLPNTGATNETGFSALPGGYRDGSGAFNNIGLNGHWWSATEDNLDYAWYRRLNYNSSKVYRDYYAKHYSYSVRCVKVVPLSGTYSIGPSSSDFLNFTEAISSLKNGGIEGPVVFNVESGTYNEQISIPEITGASEINTITFQSETGDSTDVILTYSADSTNHYTLQLNGADFIIIKNLTLSSQSEDNPRIVELINNATHNTILNNVITGGGSNGNKYYKEYLSSESSGNSYNNISENLFQGGVSAIYFANQNHGNKILKNIFENQVTSAILLDFEDSCYVGENIIKSNVIDYAWGIYLNYCDDFVRVIKNRIELTYVASTGIIINQSHGSATTRNLIANNFISVGDNGISSYHSSNIDIYFNSINVHGSTRTNSKAIDIPYYGVPFSSLQVFNNNLINFAQGYAVSIDNLSGITINYNNFFTNGANLGNYDNNDYTDIAAWQTITGQDANSVSIDPEYFSDTDLHIQDSLLKAGFPIAEVTDDIDGETRAPVTPYIGADELSILYFDSLALVALYDSTDGVNWTNNTNWFTGPVSTWYGITVSGNRVIEINLPDNNLTGTLPPEIGNLTNLIILKPSANQLTGSIPSSISNLTNLNELDFGANQLTGSIPSDISNLANLTFLSFASNQLTGSIPSEIGILTNLTYLDFNDNQLTGSIPAEIGNLVNLTHLLLSGNQLSGSIPPEIGDLTNLTQLNLFVNQLTGPIPPEISNLTNLTQIQLPYNQLSGPIPPGIVNLTNLQLLSLYNNKFTDLPDLSSITTLTDLVIHNNQFTFKDIEPNISVASFTYSPQDSVGEIIDTTVYVGTSFILSVSTGGASSRYQWKKEGINIGTVSIDSTYTINPVVFSDTGAYTCEITNTVATDLTLYSRPINVFVDYPPLQKDSLALVALYNSTDGANWTNNTNWLTGPVSTWYGITVSGGRVTQIKLNDNNLTGTIPSEIGNLTNLIHLNLHSNQLSGLIPTEIGNLTNLQYLDLSYNQLTGTIPTEIGNLTNLTELFLYSNQLSGSIPAEIGNLTNLQNLDLTFNQLSGIIPDTIYTLNNLISLGLSVNQLTGSISSDIGNLLNLQSLIIDNNSLSGSIPSEIGNLTNLVRLQFYVNEFTDLPDLSSLNSLFCLEIQDNKFTFKDIEPNIGVASTIFTYSPQDSVGEIIDTTVYTGTSYTMSVSTGGASSRYQWKKEGINIGSISIDSTYTLNPVAFSDSGAYTCEITNTVATDLTLYSRPINIFVDYPPLQKDSLALVALYNNTDGANWTNNTNWLTGNVSTWYGISVSGYRVTEINLYENNLIGTIPTEIGNLTNLTSLWLRCNQLTGSIPTEIGNLINLTSLTIDDNILSGLIPQEIGNLTNLTCLWLSGNQLLVGSIPTEIGNLTNLTDLWLFGNQLTGSVPDELINLTSLIDLELNDNQLMDLPDLSSITTLTDLYIENNKFTFEDIEPNIGVASTTFTYSPQDSVGEIIDTTVYVGTSYTMSVSTGGASSQYQWKNEGTNIGTVSIDSTYTLNPVALSDSGTYTCEITNTVATDLTLYSRPVHVSVPSTLNSENDILTYSFTEQIGTADINNTNHTISVEVVYGTNLANLVATFTISSQASIVINSIDQISGVTPNDFTNPVTYTVTAENGTPQDWIVTVNEAGIPVIIDFPYSEDFESGSGGWRTGGANSSWQLGNPAGPTINSTASGSVVWVTNLAGNYNQDEVSYITSPRFILSGINYPKIEFSIWWDAEGFYDGANFQYKQVGGVWKTLGIDEGDDSWYNSSYLYSIEKGFGFDINNSAGWSGDGEWGYGSNGWVNVSHALTGINNLSDVTFRIAFASNSSYQNDGVAIDDITIYDDPTGIDETNVLLSDIQIYPNPNRGKFRLVYNGERDIDLKLQLINLQGQVVLSEQIKAGDRFSKEFELDYLPPGIYYFRLMNKEGVAVKKMVVR